MFKLNRLLHPLKERKIFRKRGYRQRDIDFIFLFLMVIGFVFLGALLWYNFRPIKLIDVKVPVATDQSAYAQGEEISGIFFGENYYTGHTKILREVYCKDYVGTIRPPAESADGDFFSTRVEPAVYEGTSRRIGNLPTDVPIGSNCVLKFLNVYEIQTPFGIRKETRDYYTQNFAIITQERRNIVDCETSGRKDCLTTNSPKQADSDVRAVFPAPVEDTSGLQRPEATSEPQPSRTPTPESTPSEPVTPPKTCLINFFGIKLFCR